MQIISADPGLLETWAGDGSAGKGWQVAQLEVTRRACVGDDSACGLRLWLDMLLAGRNPGDQLPLTLRVRSDDWAHPQAWPPRQETEASTVAVGGAADAALGFSIEAVTRRATPASHEGFWQRYLTPRPEPGEAAVSSAGRPLEESMLEAVADYLRATLEVGTVSGARRFLESGPVGVFGSVSPRELERSGQPDLVVDATLLAEADDAAEQGDEATLLLSLYGDRHGAWLLHRRRLQPRKARRNETPPPPLYQGDVLIADSAEQLIELAGLGRTEKALFQRAGVLPRDDLRAHYLPEAVEEEGAPTPAAVDLTAFDARTRRYVDAILVLVRDKRLAAQDLDVLLRVARQMARRQ